MTVSYPFNSRFCHVTFCDPKFFFSFCLFAASFSCLSQDIQMHPAAKEQTRQENVAGGIKFQQEPAKYIGR